MVDLKKCKQFLEEKSARLRKEREELRQSLLKKLTETKKIFAKYPDIEFAYLYGSLVKQGFWKHSDIDIAINPVDYDTLQGVWGELEDLFNWEIDLKEVKPDSRLLKRIKTTGRLIYARKKTRT
ncbi:hypothetical protein J7M23_03495 [Candidatus Sumerlaeota bacterium]|nr:hypothetical protein [Candidatus Sumerlaeota bacterium]